VTLSRSGPYRLKLRMDNFYISGSKGLAMVTADFDTSKLDLNPPYFTRFCLDKDGISYYPIGSAAVSELSWMLEMIRGLPRFQSITIRQWGLDSSCGFRALHRHLRGNVAGVCGNGRFQRPPFGR